MVPRGWNRIRAAAAICFWRLKLFGLSVILRSFGDCRLWTIAALRCARTPSVFAACEPRLSRASGIAGGRKPGPTFLAAFPKINGCSPFHSIFGLLGHAFASLSLIG